MISSSFVIVLQCAAMMTFNNDNTELTLSPRENVTSVSLDVIGLHIYVRKTKKTTLL